MAEGVPDLEAFAQAKAPARRAGYLDTLPIDLADQVVQSYIDGTPSAAVVAEWLQLKGYPQATATMVCRWRRTEARKRAKASAT